MQPCSLNTLTKCVCLDECVRQVVSYLHTITSQHVAFVRVWTNLPLSYRLTSWDLELDLTCASTSVLFHLTSMCVCVCALLFSLLTDEYLPACLPLSPLCLSLCACVCAILFLHQSPWMPAMHRAISHKFSEPCKHNIYLSATLSRLLYVAVRNPQRREAAASDLYLTPTATARDPWVGKRSCQVDHGGGRGRRKSPHPSPTIAYTRAHQEVTNDCSLHPHVARLNGSETRWQYGHLFYAL